MKFTAKNKFKVLGISISIAILLVQALCICETITRTKAVDKKDTLPKGGEKFFQPMRINYVLVDSSLEVANGPKSPNLIDKTFFEEFKAQIMKPVDDYLQKLIRVYRFDINSGSKCESSVRDKQGNQFGFSVQMDTYLKGYVSSL